MGGGLNVVKASDEAILSDNVQSLQVGLVQKIGSITDIGHDAVSNIVKKSKTTKDVISEIIKLDSGNEKIAEFLLGIDALEYYGLLNPLLFNKRKILEIGLGNCPELITLNTISGPLFILLQDIDSSQKLLNIIFKNYIKAHTSIEGIDSFIKTVSGKDIQTSKKLYVMYKRLLGRAGKIMKKDLHKKALLLLEEEENPAFSLLRKHNLIDDEGKISNGAIQKLQVLVSNKINNKEIENTPREIIEVLGTIIGLGTKLLKNSAVREFLEKLQSSLSLNIIAVKSKDSVDTDDGDEEMVENLITETLPDYTDVIHEDDVEMLSYVNANFILEEKGHDYAVKTGVDTVLISQSDYSKFESGSLENYLQFHIILQQTGLSFLLASKYKVGFLRFLTHNLDGFDYISGDGFSKHYTLGALSLIGKLLGIPEHCYGNSKKIGEFEGLIPAIKAFQKIHDTGGINGEQIATPGGGGFIGNGASQTQLLKEEVLGENGGFNVEKAESLLDNGDSPFYEESQAA